MSWETLGTVSPDGDWLLIALIQSRLIRLTYTGDLAWLDKFNPRAYIRLRVGDDGVSERWKTIWPKSDEQELLILEPILADLNYLEVRKRRDPYSINAGYSITVEEFMEAPYLISYPTDPFTVDEEPYSIDGAEYRV